MRDPAKIQELYREQIRKHPDGIRGDDYRDGALDALRWVVGDTDTNPFEE